MRWRVILGVAAVTALVGSAPATAAQLYSTPGGATSGACDVAHPCDLAHLISAAGPNDELIIGPGSYGTATAPLPAVPVNNDSGLVVHGTDGQPVPQIYLSTSTGLNLGGAARVSHLAVHNLDNANGASGLFVGDGTVDGVVATSTGAAPACGGSYGSTWLDSVCVAPNFNALTLNLTAAPGAIGTIRNCTLLSANGFFAAFFSDPSANVAVNVVNTIARGGMLAQTGGSTITANADYTETTGTFDGFTTHTHTVSAAPVFVDEAHGDYRETPGASSVDAGVTNPLNGSTDLDGDLRTIGASTDIGADEFSAMPALGATATNGVDQTTVTISSTLDTGGAPTSVHAEYGPTAAYGTTSALVSVGPAAAPGQYSTDVGGLSPGTVYHARLVATNANGSTSSTDTTFTTASALSPSALPPSALPPSPTPIGGGALPIPLPSVRALAVSQLKLTVPSAVHLTKGKKSITFSVPLTSTAAVTAQVRATLQVGTKVLATTKRKVAAKSRTKLTFKLGHAARVALGHHRSVKAKLKLVITGPDGRRLSITRSVLLRL